MDFEENKQAQDAPLEEIEETAAQDAQGAQAQQDEAALREKRREKQLGFQRTVGCFAPDGLPLQPL